MHLLLLRSLLLFLLFFFLLFPVSIGAESTEGPRTVADSLQTPTEDATPNTDELPVNQDAEPVVESYQEKSFFWLIVQMIGALLLVIGLIYLLLRFVNSRTRQFQNNHTMQSIGGLSLGPNRSIQMVKIGERVLIVGVSDTIQLVKEIEDKEEIDQLLEQKKQEQIRMDQPITKAAGWLNDTIMKKKSVQKSEPLQFGQLLNKQLEDVSKSQQEIHKAMKEKKHD